MPIIHIYTLRNHLPSTFFFAFIIIHTKTEQLRILGRASLKVEFWWGKNRFFSFFFVIWIDLLFDKTLSHFQDPTWPYSCFPTVIPPQIVRPATHVVGGLGSVVFLRYCVCLCVMSPSVCELACLCVCVDVHICILINLFTLFSKI